MRLQGKIALVTGAGSGIGRATAHRFAAEGAKVAVADLRGDAARTVGGEIGGDAFALELDVCSRPSIEAGLKAVLDRFGDLDVLVNNAGVTITGAVHDLTEEQWDAQLDTNLKSIYLMSKAVWPIFVERGGGAIVNTASVAGFWAIPDDAAYCASKAGVVMLTKCMALDGAKLGIRVNCVCPGFIQTPMIEGFFEAQADPEASRAGAVGMTPLGRLGQPADIADGMLYLASDDARWVTGTALTVDGGLTSGIWGG